MWASSKNYVGIFKLYVWDRECKQTCISLRSLSARPCKGSMKFCLTSMSNESFTSASLFILSPTSTRAPPADTYVVVLYIWLERELQTKSLRFEKLHSFCKPTKVCVLSEFSAILCHAFSQQPFCLWITWTLHLPSNLRHGVQHRELCTWCCVKGTEGKICFTVIIHNVYCMHLFCQKKVNIYFDAEA